jgi:hypothetical protein
MMSCIYGALVGALGAGGEAFALTTAPLGAGGGPRPLATAHLLIHNTHTTTPQQTFNVA